MKLIILMKTNFSLNFLTNLVLKRAELKPYKI